MCVDIFSPGGAITLPYLHERVYFSMQANRLKAIIYAEAVIRNDHPKNKISTIRLQFPHYFPIGTDNKLKFYKPDEVMPEACIGMAGTIIPQHQHGKYILHATDARLSDKDYHALSLAPTHDIPSNFTHDVTAAMMELDCQIRDVDLSLSPIAPGDQLLLRFSFEPTSWPNDDLVIKDLNGFNSEYILRTGIKSPDFLRYQLKRSLKKRGIVADPLKRCIIDEGWNLEGTLTRILAHLVTVVFPQDLTFNHHVFQTSPTVVWATQEYPTVAPQFRAITFISGSDLNEKTDLIRFIWRIGDYINREKEAHDPIKGKSATIIELMNRFGADSHEAVGTLLNVLRHNEILTQLNKSESYTFTERNPPSDYSSRQQSWYDKIIKVRKIYTFKMDGKQEDDYNKALLSHFRELHPFGINLTFRWITASDVLTKKLNELTNSSTNNSTWIGSIIGFFFRGIKSPKKPAMTLDKQPASSEQDGANSSAIIARALKPTPRNAVLLVSWDYSRHNNKHADLPHLLENISEKLRDTLETVNQFRVKLIKNPISEINIQDTIKEYLDYTSDDGLFLLWYIGHATVEHEKDFTLKIPGNGTSGMSWNRINALLSKHTKVKKVCVLECCHAAGVRHHGVVLNTAIIPAVEQHQTMNFGFDKSDLKSLASKFTECMTKRAQTRTSLAQLMHEAASEIGLKPIPPIGDFDTAQVEMSLPLEELLHTGVE